MNLVEFLNTLDKVNSETQLTEGFNAEEFDRYIEATKKLGLDTGEDILDFSKEHGDVKDQELLQALETEASKLNESKEETEEDDEFDVETFKERVNSLLQLDEDGEVIECEFNDAINAVLGLFETEENEETEEEIEDETAEDAEETEMEESLAEEDNQEDEEILCDEDTFLGIIKDTASTIINEENLDDFANAKVESGEIDAETLDKVISTVEEILKMSAEEDEKEDVEESLEEESKVCPNCGKEPCECDK